MTRVALDSNILMYAELEPESAKGKRAADLILRAARDGVIPVQVLAEYLRFVQRRAPASFEEAIRQVSLYKAVFLTPPTTDVILNRASDMGAPVACNCGIVWCAQRPSTPAPRFC